MDLHRWLLEELDDAVGRMIGQVLDLVPVERRLERPGGGNSVAWTLLHVARHADLAVAAVSGAAAAFARGGDGLDEAQRDEVALDPAGVAEDAIAALSAAGYLLSRLDVDALERVIDPAPALRAAGVPEDRYAWLYGMWAEQPVAFFVRWPLIGHVNNHVGEMIATRGRLGLSPY